MDGPDGDIELRNFSDMDHGGSDNDDDDAGDVSQINRRVVFKIDFILLPFLSLLFLLNALDKSNVGNAEAAHFTKDLGLPESALNLSVAWFFAVFVALQPVGAYFGRKLGMVRWVPTCMALWGLCTALHVVVRSQWQLVVLRVLVGALEAGFYPTTVSYLSLWYTRFEFGKRLAFFYGQASLAGALGGLLSWAVFSYFPTADVSHTVTTGWKSWEVLFLLEGSLTIVVALLGFFWLPHSADTAWFLTPDERRFAEARIRDDRDPSSAGGKRQYDIDVHDRSLFDQDSRPLLVSQDEEEADRLPSIYPLHRPSRRRASHVSAMSVTADSGLTRADLFSAAFDWKVWYLLFCNILSAIPATAFSVFLPLVIKGIASSRSNHEVHPAVANLLVIPPFLAGAIVLWVFAAYSDRTQKRLVPVLYGLAILLAGLTATVMLPQQSYTQRYIALVVLLSGSYVASPLTVSWLSNNIPEPGKRAIVLGINGWGNLAGVFSALLFAPRFAKQGYVIPFYATLACVMVAFVGYLLFIHLVNQENQRRTQLIASWDEDEVEREAMFGDMTIPDQRNVWTWFEKVCGFDRWCDRVMVDRIRRGDQRLTFTYSL